MQRNQITVLCHGIAVCALWVCGLTMLQSAAPAQTSQDTKSEKTSKARKSKKSAADAASKESAAPAVAGEKTSKAKKSKQSTADAASKETATPAAAEEKTAKPRKSKKSDSTSSGSASRAQTGGSEQSAPAPVRNASRGEIQSAKTGGKVWVNTDSGVYHKSGQWYGATKQGKFMTEQEAIKAGYKAAKNEK
jgi:hypothetical protein